MSHSNLFLAFAEKQPFRKRKKDEKKWAGQAIPFDGMISLLTLHLKVSNRSCHTDEMAYI